jgi:hypothetical protein
LLVVLALVVVGGVGLMWPRVELVDLPPYPPMKPDIKVWDASDGQQEPK